MSARDGETRVTREAEAAAPTDEAWLVCLSGVDQGRRFEVRPGRWIVGRDAECDVPLTDPGVSRRHCEVTWGPEGAHVRDLRSTNGTTVEGEPVGEGLRPLRSGERLGLGEAVLKFLAGDDVEWRWQTQLEREARIDPLTGLANRRAFAERLEAACARVRRSGGSLHLVLFDVDHFKSVNDRHGHPAGDAVLQALARRLQPMVRADDLLARWGGEEFAVLLADLDHADARRAAERLAGLAAAEPVRHGDRVIPVTLSGGVAAYEPTLGPDALVEQADARLYAAKRAGRNRVDCESPCT